MLFNSLDFLIFYVVIFFLYWAVPREKIKLQNILLLCGSYFFYGWWDWRFLSIIVFSTVVDYILGLQIEKQAHRKKLFLKISIFTNLCLLGVFKYFNFFIDSWVDLWSIFGYEMSVSTLNIILPVGISFYTFQTMSYTIDVYRGDIKATKDFLAFATFVSFFPQLVAGPIERASNLIPQLTSKRVWNHQKFKDAILQIAVGFFRKVVVADSIGAFIDHVYNAPDIYNSPTIFVAVILYSFQVYFDFSGYSDIANGTARILGFDFKRNFNLPYFSSSISEFWRRWHLSLSRWLRDYLYIPMGGNRRGDLIQYRNILVTLLLAGLWHGSSWNFVIWGGIHGLLLCFEKRTGLIPKNFKLGNCIVIFLILSLSRIFFRSLDIGDSFVIIQKLVNWQGTVVDIRNISIFATVLYGLLITFIIDTFLFVSKIDLEELGSKIKDFGYVALVCFLTINIVLFFSSSNTFIYFQF